VAKRSGYRRFCSLATGLDIVGERWTLVILQELLHRPLRYGELRDKVPGIGSNVLAERLRMLEQHLLVERSLGPVGSGVVYRLTARGEALGPALVLFRQWALDELLPPNGGTQSGRESVSYDLSYAVSEDAGLSETYEWRIDDDVYALMIDGTTLTVADGRARKPTVTVRTTREFMNRWVAGATTWDQGRLDDEVHVTGSKSAWQRMLVATGYPGRDDLRSAD
jgi:DNA-binding HxlR family transcriptional regulator